MEGDYKNTTFMTVGAFLQSRSAQSEEFAKERVDTIMKGCLKFAEEYQKDLIPLILGNWHSYYIGIKGDHIPSSWIDPIITIANQHNSPTSK